MSGDDKKTGLLYNSDKDDSSGSSKSTFGGLSVVKSIAEQKPRWGFTSCGRGNTHICSTVVSRGVGDFKVLTDNPDAQAAGQHGGTGPSNKGGLSFFICCSKKRRAAAKAKAKTEDLYQNL